LCQAPLAQARQTAIPHKDLREDCDPQRFAAALLKLNDTDHLLQRLERDPQRFAAALLKPCTSTSHVTPTTDVIRSDSLRPY